MHNRDQIAFESRKLREPKRLYSIYDKEIVITYIVARLPYSIF